MKITIAFFALFLIVFSTSGQKTTFKERIGYVTKLGVNNSFLSELNGINDHEGFKRKIISLGLSIGGYVTYQTSPKAAILFGLPTLTLKRIQFRYYDQNYVSSTISHEIPILLRYQASKKYSFSGGISFDFQLNETYFYFESEPVADPSLKQAFISESFRVANPILSLGASRSWQKKNGRMWELALMYNQGLKTFTVFNLKRFTPTIISTFSTRGSNVCVEMRWYLKRQKTDDVMTP